MATVALNRDGTTAIVVEKTLVSGVNPRQWVIPLGESMPVLGAGGVTDYIGEFVGILEFGINGRQYTAEFDWLRGGVLLVTGNDVRVSARRDNADVASPLEIDVTADIEDEKESLQARPFVRPQKTLLLNTIAMGTATPVGTLPKFAARIIGVNAILVNAGELSLRLERNDDVTIVSQRQFTAAADFGAVDIPIPIDATRVIGAETTNMAGREVSNLRVIFELALP